MVIVVDAGHGGTDPGAIGISGLMEKEVNLKVALKLGNLLKNIGVDVLYTRSTDVYISLSDRSNFANQNNADYFISIHANSATAASANGIETYVYLEDGVTEKFAEAVQTNLIKETNFTDRGVKIANFYVLRTTNMPAILVEMGFLSNAIEEAMLKQDSFLDKIASGIYNGVVEYLGLEFRDEPEVPHWGQQSLDKMLELGLITSPKEPDSPVSWAEFATVTLRILNR
ncbi:MAG: N-acetylmuramoyl-L-alanine amidase [Epulopiscium sp. Nuni2H_MBin003]|nr:MAG: N-acetylmuramoyl-L-alanine amidase [Epulopiscium sp. Nuni2H_MBin003]